MTQLLQFTRQEMGRCPARLYWHQRLNVRIACGLGAADPGFWLVDTATQAKRVRVAHTTNTHTCRPSSMALQQLWPVRPKHRPHSAERVLPDPPQKRSPRTLPRVGCAVAAGKEELTLPPANKRMNRPILEARELFIAKGKEMPSRQASAACEELWFQSNMTHAYSHTCTLIYIAGDVSSWRLCSTCAWYIREA